MSDMIFGLKLLLFIRERICCLQEQFDKDFTLLPDPQRSSEHLHSDIEDVTNNRDVGLKLSFLRLSRLMHVTMLLTLVYFCNICFWFMMTRKEMSRSLRSEEPLSCL